MKGTPKLITVERSYLAAAQVSHPSLLLQSPSPAMPTRDVISLLNLVGHAEISLPQ